MEWLKHFQRVGEYYLIFEVCIFITGIVGLFVLMQRSRYGKLGLMSAVILTTAFIIPVIHGTLPFARTWIFLSPFLIWLLLDVSRSLKVTGFPIVSKFKKTVFAALLILSGFWGYSSLNNITWFGIIPNYFRDLADALIEKGYERVYLQDYYAFTFLLYYYSNTKPEVRDSVKVTVDGREKLSKDEWIKLCNEYDVMVFSASFANDSLVGSCVVDSNWTYVILEKDGCECFKNKLNL